MWLLTPCGCSCLVSRTVAGGGNACLCVQKSGRDGRTALDRHEGTKETSNMKKSILTAVAVGVFSLAAIGGASAETRPTPTNENANCIGQLSSSWTQNGQAGTLGNGGNPNHKGGLRGDEIHMYQSA